MMRFACGAIVALCTWLACSSEPPNHWEADAPRIVEIRVPSVLNRSQTYPIQAVVADPQGAPDVRYVLMTRYAQGIAVATDTLWDDGGFLHPDDGDEIAKDGVFSQRIRWTSTQSAAESLSLEFRAVDQAGHWSETVVKSVLLRANSPPLIVTLSVPDTLPSGFQGSYLFCAEVFDSQGVADVSVVRFRALQGGAWAFDGVLVDDGTQGDEAAGDGRFSMRVEAAFAAGKKGDYRLIFVAADLGGAQSPEVQAQLFIANGPPMLSQLSLPDSVTKPASGVIFVPITVAASDPQSLTDIKRVGFTSQKPDLSYANGGQPVPMVDNGLPFDPLVSQAYGDQVAGDGVYTFTLVVYADQEASKWDPRGSPIQQGWYTFTFQAEDKVGNTSEAIARPFKIK
ncbi:MAG: hypothetical protein QHJ34_10145 [bacterium]|jgi:hypothetical protein|nr:hypothetical protein [candidate division KSB1 bacterium]MDH7560578.1 hypothetical protein [bacterium]